MNDEWSNLNDPDKLRQDLGSEYQALIKIVSDFDGRLVTVKGWSVTLSLAGLGLGFQYSHFALFGLAALTSLVFWVIESVMKRQQARYYGRMREIEVDAFHINRLLMPDGSYASAPRVDWAWINFGKQPPSEEPISRGERESRRLLLLAPLLPHVFLPHILALIVGSTLFWLEAAHVPGMANLQP